jgi:hypothetical protein
MSKNLSHIFLNTSHESMAFTASGQIGSTPIPERDRQQHSERLLRKFDLIWSELNRHEIEREAVSLPSRTGSYLEFRSLPGYDLVSKSLEDIKQGIRLLNVRYTGEQGSRDTIATVYIPQGKQGHFVRKIQEYASKETASGNPRHSNLIQSIEDIQVALLESMWTDPIELIPQTSNRKWCEVWLRTDINNENTVIEEFQVVLNNLNLQYKTNYITFPERAVILCYTDKEDLTEIIERSDNIAEFRIGQEATGFWVQESNRDQAQWAQDLLARLRIADSNVKVCILDTGVHNAHPLLNPVLADEDCLTVNAAWGVTDHHGGCGHGTPMSGLAAYGTLEDKLAGNNEIILTHRLCSVKVLPPPYAAATPIELWGDYTDQGISRAELQSSESKLIFCMAITSVEEIDRGKPSSWSAKIDEIAFGTEEYKRIVIVSSGNVIADYWPQYPDSNLLSSVQNPAQAWNALTVGAFTEKIHIHDQAYNSHRPLAPHGGLSPFSSTSNTWENKWPVKPDVVFEGGNISVSPNEDYIAHDDYQLLTTSKHFDVLRNFDAFNATSAATAQASWLAAKIFYEYPEIWPETVRGLMVHSAEWTNPMIQQFNIDMSRKNSIRTLLRTFGYGVPQKDKALYSLNNRLTYISQAVIQPFEGSKTKDMHFYDIPWPKDELLALENTPVKLRITLSYFIEPGPGEIGWRDKYRYPSFGLRFDLNSPSEEKDKFIKRINVAAREEGEINDSHSGSGRWLIGSRGRATGSIHADIWEGYAADIATCNLLAVYPVIGWWRERKHLGKSDTKARYSLIVSLETPPTDIDLYTPVKNQITNRVPVVIETGI